MTPELPSEPTPRPVTSESRAESPRRASVWAVRGMVLLAALVWVGVLAGLVVATPTQPLPNAAQFLLADVVAELEYLPDTPGTFRVLSARPAPSFSDGTAPIDRAPTSASLPQPGETLVIDGVDFDKPNVPKLIVPLQRVAGTNQYRLLQGELIAPRYSANDPEYIVRVPPRFYVDDWSSLEAQLKTQGVVFP